MKTKLSVLALGLLFLSLVNAQTGKSTAGPAFAGTWQGTTNGLPSIDLKIENAGSKLAGTAVFYLQTRKDESEPWHVASQTTLPMLSPTVQGKRLSFEVPHHTCHGCTDYGANVRFEMELTGQNEARLVRFGDSGEQRDSLKLVRKQ
jgi:hypothetical protein